MAEILVPQCEFICQGCGRREPGEYYGLSWHKPREWYERSDRDGVQTACSRQCVETISRRTGKTAVVLPI